MNVIRGLAMADYLALPAVNASMIREITNRCPAAAWFCSWLNPARVIDFDDASDAGTIAHSILLEGSRDCCVVIDPRDYPAKTTGSIPDGWTNVAIRSARDAVRAAGKIPVLTTDMQTIDAMVASAQAFIDGLRTTEPAIWRAFQPDGGESELTLLWDDAGTACRIRPDRISADRCLVVDVKTTKRSAEPESWSRTHLFGGGYYVSAAFYRRGVAAVYGVEAASYVFLVIEQDAPYLCSLVGVDEAAFALGASVVEQGLRAWRRCVASNDWPSYPPKVCYAETPQWLLAQGEAREAGGDWRILFPEIAEEIER